MSRGEHWYDSCAGHPLIQQAYADITVDRAIAETLPEIFDDIEVEEYRARIE